MFGRPGTSALGPSDQACPLGRQLLNLNRYHPSLTPEAVQHLCLCCSLETPERGGRMLGSLVNPNT